MFICMVQDCLKVLTIIIFWLRLSYQVCYRSLSSLSYFLVQLEPKVLCFVSWGIHVLYLHVCRHFSTSLRICTFEKEKVNMSLHYDYIAIAVSLL